MSYLDIINSPADVKKLSLKELEALAEEIRSAVLNRDSKIGGHVGPNLGIVETTIALHYVFNSPEDKIVYDVSHQSYPHKILTGRKNGFLTDECGRFPATPIPQKASTTILSSGILPLRSVWPAVWPKPVISKAKSTTSSRLSATVRFPAAKRSKVLTTPRF